MKLSPYKSFLLCWIPESDFCRVFSETLNLPLGLKPLEKLCIPSTSEAFRSRNQNYLCEISQSCQVHVCVFIFYRFDWRSAVSLKVTVLNQGLSDWNQSSDAIMIITKTFSASYKSGLFLSKHKNTSSKCLPETTCQSIMCSV